MILDIYVHVLLICDICVYRQRARERESEHLANLHVGYMDVLCIILATFLYV